MIAATALAALAMAAPAGAASVGPTSKDFGSEPVGAVSAATSFTLTNSGQICTMPNLIVPGICDLSSSYFTDTSALGTGPGGTITSGDFVIHNVNCPYPTFQSPPTASDAGVPPQSCQFEVSFLPTTGGALSKTLSFSDTGGLTATLSLTGTGLSPPSTTPTQTTTGLRAAAASRCKKKFPKGSSKRKKCLRRANQLPI
jgi:hypothetical protein